MTPSLMTLDWLYPVCTVANPRWAVKPVAQVNLPPVRRCRQDQR